MQRPGSTTRRPLLIAGVIVIAAVLALLLVGPRVWARGQVNLFGLELAAGYDPHTALVGTPARL